MRVVLFHELVCSGLRDGVTDASLFLPLLILPVELFEPFHVVLDSFILAVEPVSKLIFLHRELVVSHLLICHCQIIVRHQVVLIDLQNLLPSENCFVPMIIMRGSTP